MGFEVRVSDGGFVATDPLPDDVTVDGPMVMIGAAPLSVPERYVHVTGDAVRFATTFDDLARGLRSADIPIEASPDGISQLLTLGVYDTPTSAIRNVWRLSSADTFAATVNEPGTAVAHGLDDRWNPSRSSNDGEPSTTRLRELIAGAVDEQVTACDGDAALMLSSGKDSVALAVALADTGHTDVPCFTSTSGDDDREHVYAAELCARLGLTHHTVRADDGDPRAALMRFFEHSSEPTADLSVVPSMLIAQRAGDDLGGMLNGIANDPYMGWSATGTDRLKWRLRVRNRALASAIRRRIPIDSGVNYFTRSPIGTLITLRMFRPHDVARFYPDAVDTDDTWYRRSHRHRDDFVAWCSEVKRTQAEGRSMAKVLRVAEAAGHTALLPFRDDRVARYYLDLPEADRIDRRTGTNKILLRRMLSEAVDYDEAEVGANWFAFDGQRFLLDHADWVRDEVLGCALWGGDIEPLLTQWMDQLARRPLLHHALHALFVVSGWHNHTRHLTRR